MKITKKDEKRFDEIEKNAIGWYLDKTDFDISEWIATEDRQFWGEFRKEEDGFCPFCGIEMPEVCECLKTNKK